MSLQATVLFAEPHSRIAGLIAERMERARETSILTGFATPDGIGELATPIKARPTSIACFLVGGATYPAFEALDDLRAEGVPPDRVFIHLGHTRSSGGKKNPFVRFHPMLHSKIYYMEHSDNSASVFIGSHNATFFALSGLNGEASVLLEGPSNADEFRRVRRHIEMARQQSVPYDPCMKEALAWWSREYIDGLRAEVKIPQDWSVVRTIIVFAELPAGAQPIVGDQFYFEIPAGIEQIESLRTETHLFLFRTLPSDPREAIARIAQADISFTCATLGAENRQGNLEIIAKWRTDLQPQPVFVPIPGNTFRPDTQAGKQQVRAEITAKGVRPFEYLFDHQRKEWDPRFSNDPPLTPVRPGEEPIVQPNYVASGWQLVRGLVPRDTSARHRDEAALKLADPDSGSFFLVSVRRRETVRRVKRR